MFGADIALYIRSGQQKSATANANLLRRRSGPKKAPALHQPHLCLPSTRLSSELLGRISVLRVFWRDCGGQVLLGHAPLVV